MRIFSRLSVFFSHARRRAIKLLVIGIAIIALLAQTGCVVLPIPWPANHRYSPEQIAKIREGYTSREAVTSELGMKGDLTRLDDRYWVYYWIEDSGRWFFIPLIIPTGPDPNLGPIFSKQFILFLEFDANGIVRSKQFLSKELPREAANRYCTTNDLCIENKIRVGNRNVSNIAIYDFDNMESAFTVVGSGKDSVPLPAPSIDRCVVVIWPAAPDWEDMKGLRLALGDPPQGPPSWLPVGSYLALSLPAGNQAVYLINYPFMDPRGEVAKEEGDAETFWCEAGNTVYMSVGKTSKSKEPLPSDNIGITLHSDNIAIILKAIDPETGSQTITGMRRLLPPETKAR